MTSKRTEFLQAAVSSDNSECVLWPFAVRASSGYGAHSISLGRRGLKRSVDAHVYVCEAAYGPRPTSTHQAAHACGNKLCCNPKLSLGRELGMDPAYVGKVRRGECHVG